MKKTYSVQKLTVAALLIAVGIVIPMFSPVKIILEPASFTLASHVPIILSMFISPLVAVAVTIGTTLGFFLGGFPLVVVLRAASHIVFAFFGALYLQKNPGILYSWPKLFTFSFAIAAVHAVCEVFVVSMFYAAGGMGGLYYQQGFFISVMLLVGIGTIVHSMVDFAISIVVLKVLNKQKSLQNLFVTGQVKATTS
ncbi:hypothetical protein LJC49_05285 [Ruminococcaceae bacterium OttesenSCG-928-I18]|nr:hypothetical protein [Ruminococcaceae bacterium OttesenSCG-928-I18]